MSGGRQSAGVEGVISRDFVGSVGCLLSYLCLSAFPGARDLSRSNGGVRLDERIHALLGVSEVREVLSASKLNGHYPYRYRKDVLEHLPTHSAPPHRRTSASPLAYNRCRYRMNIYELLGLVAIGSGVGCAVGYVGSMQLPIIPTAVAILLGVTAGVIAFLKLRRTVILIHLKQPTERTMAILCVLMFVGVLLVTCVAEFVTLSITGTLNR